MKKLTIILLFSILSVSSYSQQCYGYNCHKSKAHKVIGVLCGVLLFTPIAAGIINYQLTKEK